MSRTDTPAPARPEDRPAPPLRVAIVGAESTGKSRLAGEIARILAAGHGLRCRVVDEALRQWCERAGRTPRPEEQGPLAREHARLIEAAATQDIDVLICDTTPLMVDVYSQLLFSDASLEPLARDCHRTMAATLLTGLDLPWVADGIMRDGPHVRPPVDAAVRQRLLSWNVPWCVVRGEGDARTEVALAALAPVLAPLLAGRGAPPHHRRLFSTLIEGVAPAPFACERCDPPSVRPS